MATTAFEYDDEVHVSSCPSRGRLWAKSRAQRRALLTKAREALPVSVYMLAAIQLQRFWRGVLLRRRVLRKYLTRDFRRQWRADEDIVRQAHALAPQEAEASLSSLLGAVQARWRTSLLRQEFGRWTQYDRWPIYYVAATTVQRAWTEHVFRRHKRRHKQRAKRVYLSKEHALAGMIQLAWRGYVSRQIFRFFKQLIKFREGGDPILMLRAINPSEAYLMDPAAGLHVRFRLGGSAFPPAVYYKIFTHRAVADVGAFAPKDYTVARKHATPAMTHNVGTRGSQMGTNAQAREGWYQREENNPWRPVAPDTFAGKGADALPLDGLTADELRYSRFLDRHVLPAARARPFYATVKKRRDARAQAAKNTKRRWLVELYSAEQESMSKLPKGTVREQANALFDTLDDGEIEEESTKLMEWSRHLDFGEYKRDWQRLATTAPTDFDMASALASAQANRGPLAAS